MVCVVATARPLNTTLDRFPASRRAAFPDSGIPRFTRIGIFHAALHFSLLSSPADGPVYLSLVERLFRTILFPHLGVKTFFPTRSAPVAGTLNMAVQLREVTSKPGVVSG